MHRQPLRALGALAVFVLAACGDDAANPLAPGLPSPPGGGEEHEDRVLFLEAARGAWTYVEVETNPATGLVNSVAAYPYTTIWDVASGLAAVYAAGELGIIPAGEYRDRMGRMLGTLETLPLFESSMLNRVYSVRTGAITGFSGPHDGTEPGSGWSSTDLGRLLIWLRVIAENDPAHGPQARRVAERMDLGRLVEDGYLVGAQVEPGGGVRTYQEGRVGYEQYAAYGLALWGHRADRALRLAENTIPITIFDLPLVADRRGNDHLTSEPFLLAGMEVGWSRDMRDLAVRMLQVQEERYRRTGQVTVLSEDALDDPPHYFYYYAFNFHGTPFAVLGPDSDAVLDRPRWVSAKAAFGWHALLPGPYTRLSIFSVSPALERGRGWGSGIYEGSGRPTGAQNVNTAAVILEAALFARSGRPLVYGG